MANYFSDENISHGFPNSCLQITCSRPIPLWSFLICRNATETDFHNVSELVSRLHIPALGLGPIAQNTAIIQATQHQFYILPNFALPCLNDSSGSLLFLPSALACCFRNSILGHSHMFRLLQRRTASFLPGCCKD